MEGVASLGVVSSLVEAGLLPPDPETLQCPVRSESKTPETSTVLFCVFGALTLCVRCSYGPGLQRGLRVVPAFGKVSEFLRFSWHVRGLVFRGFRAQRVAEGGFCIVR